MEAEYLNVYYEHQLVGQLWQDNHGKIGFRYNNTWLTNGFPVSLQLPLQEDEFSTTAGVAHQFFANLLPEEGARLQIVRDLKISDSDYSLLKAIGGECAGALSILPPELTLNRAYAYKEFDHEELKVLLLRKGNITSFIEAEHRPRLSLAGAHQKCPIRYENHRYFLPKDTAPSTHILKFQITEYKHIPIYECFMSKLAKALSIPVAKTALEQLEDIQFLLVERFDRTISENHQIRRLHQEDFCQAMGRRFKYQQEGGPSFAECVKLIKNVSIKPIKDTENLLKWQVFNVLAGNSDGHAKNIALLYDQNQQISLAPFYDLVCTRAIERIDTKLAMSVGGEFDPDKISEKHWQQEAKLCDVRPQYLLEIMRDVAKNMPEIFASTVDQFEKDYGQAPVLQRVRKIVLKQCNKALKMMS